MVALGPTSLFVFCDPVSLSNYFVRLSATQTDCLSWPRYFFRVIIASNGIRFVLQSSSGRGGSGPSSEFPTSSVFCRSADFCQSFKRWSPLVEEAQQLTASRGRTDHGQDSVPIGRAERKRGKRAATWSRSHFEP